MDAADCGPVNSSSRRKSNRCPGRLNSGLSVTIAAEPIPPSKPDAAPKAVAGVATWDEVEPEPRAVQHLRVRAVQRLDGARRPGAPQGLGAGFQARRRQNAAGRPARLLFLPSHGGHPTCGPGGRTAADHRRPAQRLEKARYAAAVTDAEKALHKKDKEIADAADELDGGPDRGRGADPPLQGAGAEDPRAGKAKREGKTDDRPPIHRPSRAR